MHIEILVEDSSGEKLLNFLLPQFLGPQGQPHTWRLHAYKGIGKIPKGLKASTDAFKRILLDQLPRLLKGYGKTPGIDAVVIVLDSDSKNCKNFLAELKAIHASCDPAPRTLFRLAIEEIEAWYLGDIAAVIKAYPKAKTAVLEDYIQDSVCGTWELLADAIYPGGATAIKKEGWPLPGQVKHEWAEAIGPFLDVNKNKSPSFQKLRDGLLGLTGAKMTGGI